MENRQNNKQQINMRIRHYIDLALQLLLKEEHLKHLFLIYFSSIEKDILKNRNKFIKDVCLDFGYSKSDFKGNKFVKKGQFKMKTKSKSFNNEYEYIESPEYNNNRNTLYNILRKYGSNFMSEELNNDFNGNNTFFSKVKRFGTKFTRGGASRKKNTKCQCKIKLPKRRCLY